MPTCTRCKKDFGFWAIALVCLTSFADGNTRVLQETPRALGDQFSGRQTNRCPKCAVETRQILNRIQQRFLQGFISLDELSRLQELAYRNSITPDEMAAFIERDVELYLTRVLDGDFGMVASCPDYVRRVRDALAVTGMPSSAVARLERHYQVFHEIERGMLPVVPRTIPIKLLYPDEQCHFDSEAVVYLKENPKSTTTIPGRLVATNLRLIFIASGASGSHELTWKKVGTTDLRMGIVSLQESKPTKWEPSREIRRQYRYPEPLLLKAVVDALVNKAKQQPESPMRAAEKRSHIPLAVRQAVWERDRGRCVQCGAWGPGAQLEFDHIIPYSKGGADTVDNLQLLCRQCNRQKSNRI